MAELTEQLRQRAHSGPAAPEVPGPGVGLPDMPSLQGFREVWAQVAAEAQLSQALARAPENAGPLNSHRLVLQTLVLMRELSPIYLRHFLSHLDALLWLEQAQGGTFAKGPAPVARPGRRNRPKV